MRVFAQRGAFPHASYVIAFGVGGGLLLAGICLFAGRVRRVRIDVILLSVCALYYTLQASLVAAYNVYMPMDTVIGEMGHVTAEYGGALARAVWGAVPAAVVFFLPVVICAVVFRRKERMAGEYVPGMCVLFAGLALLVITSSFARTGPMASSYHTAFTFDRAVSDFGLFTGARLQLTHRLFGNGSAGYHTDYAAEDMVVPETPTPTPTPAPTDTEEREPAPSVDPSPTPTPVIYAPQTMDIDFSSAGQSANASVSALTDYILSQQPVSQNAYTGLFRGKNLIYICAEAYTDVFLDPELTPTLWRLSRNGFYFSDFYQPAWGGSTTSGESSFVLGLVPLHAGGSMKITAGNNNYFTLGNALQREGYSSIAFHNGSYTFYRRDMTHENLGYERYIASENGLADLCDDVYPIDTLMMEKTVPLYRDHTPFSVYYMTISGHAGYYGDSGFVAKYYDRVQAVYGDKYAEKTKYYICYQMELEEAMRILVEGLEEAGIADDTVIVMTGDHYPYGLDQSAAWGNDRNYVADLMGEDDGSPFVRDRNGLILWCGSLEREDKAMATSITTPTYTLDVVPTLLNLFGIPYDSRLLPGRDVFSDAEPLVLWNNGTWLTNEGRYVAGSGDFSLSVTYPDRNGIKHPGTLPDDPDVIRAYVDRINAMAENKIRLSRTIVEEDYYGILFGPDTVTTAGEPIFKQ